MNPWNISPCEENHHGRALMADEMPKLNKVLYPTEGIYFLLPL